MKERTYKATWRSEKAEAKYRKNDAAVWARATSSPPEAIDVSTTYGSTRAYRWPGSGPPVLFVHGMSDTSVRWIPFAEALDGHDVYAVDIMGDVGNSKPDTGFTSAADYGLWLAQTIEALGLDAPHVVGHSLGGYVVLSLALGPTPLSSVVAFDPVGVVKLRLMRFMRWGFVNGISSFMPGPIRHRMAERQRMPVLHDKAAGRLLVQANMGHPPKMPPLPVFTDDELTSITAPLWLVTGDKSIAFDVNKMVERVSTLVAGAHTQIVPDAGHALTQTHFDECLAVVRRALAVDANRLATD